jgi:plasmid maintenance system killer protein
MHGTRGDLQKDCYILRVRRVTFRFEGGDAYDVDLEDYH